MVLGSPPFSHKIMEELVPCNFKALVMEAYDGITDPFDYLESFKSLMLLQGPSDVLICKSFLITFRKVVRAWYTQL